MVALAVGASTAVSAGASLAGSAMQADAAGEAAGMSMAQYQQTREDLTPYREIGKSALYKLGAMYGAGHGRVLSADEMKAATAQFYDEFTSSPDYQFAFDEGLRTLDRSASARGRLQGGGYGRELTRYGQGVASQQYNNYANRLAALAGVGQAATTQTGQFGAQSTQAAGNAIQNAGTARASGYAGAANAINSGAQNYMLMNYMNKNPQTSMIPVA